MIDCYKNETPVEVAFMKLEFARRFASVPVRVVSKMVGVSAPTYYSWLEGKHLNRIYIDAIDDARIKIHRAVRKASREVNRLMMLPHGKRWEVLEPYITGND